jgi:hypothetical protein
MLLPAVVALLTLAGAVMPVTAAPRPQLLLIVYQELNQPLTAATLRRIGEEVAGIWRPYVDVALQAADSLTPPRADDSLRLVLTDRRSNGRTVPGLGWIDFVDGEPAKTITVSVTAAHDMAARGRWAGRSLSVLPAGVGETFLVRTLGRAVAHEVGHYLLRSTDHTVRGLMRPTLSVDEIMGRSGQQYRLLPAEEALLKVRITPYASTRVRSDDLPLQ